MNQGQIDIWRIVSSQNFLESHFILPLAFCCFPTIPPYFDCLYIVFPVSILHFLICLSIGVAFSWPWCPSVFPHGSDEEQRQPQILNEDQAGVPPAGHAPHQAGASHVPRSHQAAPGRAPPLCAH